MTGIRGTDVRSYEGAGGRYLHAGDLAAVLRGAWADMADPVTALGLRAAARGVDALNGARVQCNLCPRWIVTDGAKPVPVLCDECALVVGMLQG